MSKAEKIKAAIEELSLEERAELAALFLSLLIAESDETPRCCVRGKYTGNTSCGI